MVLYPDLIRVIWSQDFVHFQEQLSRSWYSAMVKGYQSGASEDKLVQRLVNASKGISFPKWPNIKIGSKFIHGHRSQVEYEDFNGERCQCELGDMAIVSAVVEDKRTVFLRLCFVQNKKGMNKKTVVKWEIDERQLFLLKHFPPITGRSGILKGFQNTRFTNWSRCLGAYGLLYEPGEMTFISAPLLASLMKGKKSINSRDIALPTTYPYHCAPWPYCHVYTYYEPFDYPRIPLPYCGTSPVLGNTIFARDIYDFIVAWTQLNIGEIVVCDRNIIDNEAYSLATALIKIVFPNYPSIEGPSLEMPDDVRDDEAGIGIFVYLIDISQQR